MRFFVFLFLFFWIVGENILLEFNLVMNVFICEVIGFVVVVVGIGYRRFLFFKILDNLLICINFRNNECVVRWIFFGIFLMWRTLSYECGCGCRRELILFYVNFMVIILFLYF